MKLGKPVVVAFYNNKKVNNNSCKLTERIYLVTSISPD